MHELSIALGIIDIASDELVRHEGGSIVSVHVKIGQLSGVVKEALQSAFELAREGSALESSNLVIEDIPVVVFCSQCQCEQVIEQVPDLRCPGCGAYTSRIVSGRELEVVAMEIES